VAPPGELRVNVGVVWLAGNIGDPHLSALDVRFSRRCAIQIDVYLPTYRVTHRDRRGWTLYSRDCRQRVSNYHTTRMTVVQKQRNATSATSRSHRVEVDGASTTTNRIEWTVFYPNYPALHTRYDSMQKAAEGQSYIGRDVELAAGNMWVQRATDNTNTFLAFLPAV